MARAMSRPWWGGRGFPIGEIFVQERITAPGRHVAAKIPLTEMAIQYEIHKSPGAHNKGTKSGDLDFVHLSVMTDQILEIHLIGAIAMEIP